MSCSDSCLFLSQDTTTELLKEVSQQEIDCTSSILFDVNYSSYTLEDTAPFEEYKQVLLEPAGHLELLPEPTYPIFQPRLLNDPLINDEYSGPYEFEVAIVPDQKSPWIYSPLLNKVFLELGKQFPVTFKTRTFPQEALFIRVTPKYSGSQHSIDAVVRCIQHDYHADPSNKDIPAEVRAHVIRCANRQVSYLGNKDQQERLSLVLPLIKPEVGADSVFEFFQFVCTSTCPTPGINRRSLELIFTLENVNGSVVGRKSVNVKICACPKRDQIKDEAKYKNNKNGPPVPRGKKRKAACQPANPGKVLPASDNDTKVYPITINVVGKQTQLKVLSYIEDALAHDLLNHQGEPSEGLYQKVLDDTKAEKNRALNPHH
ncbi:cellular tumor antigen p53 isoform X1 [Sitophilus oryzae]|uniref:Cellular tumor antigen p53 isoform X1 n=1 Tax=Sitophilus oryzae TaxID=7048 RepID=A0A6J2YS80_SITOR|nr:cellular tumor antigen p53 isoform X1 [Sitophilus oryzae]